MLSAIVFDFDGLIFDSETPEYAAWQEAYADHGVELRLDEWLEVIGRGAKDEPWDPYDRLEQRCGRAVDREAVRARRRSCYLRMTAGAGALPGVERLIAEAGAAGVRLGVASSSRREWVAGKLEELGLLGAFERLRCADDVPRTKPDPELYQSLLREWGLSPDGVVALEDSANGIAAAKAAGLVCVAVPNGVTRHGRLDAADVVVESLEEVSLASLRQLCARRLESAPVA